MSPMAFAVPADDGSSHQALLYQADMASHMDVLLVLAHGAGAGQSHPFMVRYARGLAERGLNVVTFNFPYMEARRRSPDRAPVLEAAFRATVITAAAHRHVHAKHLFIGGKSMGGRMATHLAAARDGWPPDAPPLDGVIVLGYPLTPPGGRRSQDRVSHLLRIDVPTLIVQGTRDSFGGPQEILAALRANHEKSRAPEMIAVHAVEGGDHSFALPKSTGRTQSQVDGEIQDAVIQFIRTHLK